MTPSSPRTEALRPVTLRRIYKGALVLAAGWLAWVMTANVMANVTARQAPHLALRFWSEHAEAQTRYADTLITANPGRAGLLEASAYAASALRRDPTRAAAARILAMQALLQRNEARAIWLFDYSAAMSKRDLPTQLWFLEREVARNHVERALDRYGIILNVFPETKDTLFPILTAAMADPGLIRPIAQLAQRGGDWRSGFIYFVGEHARDPETAANFLMILAQLNAVLEMDQIHGPLWRLQNARNYAAAARLYRLIDPRWAVGDPASQVDGGFDRPRDLAPFGWEINGDLAWRGGRADNSANQALYANLEGGNAAWVARRQLVIPSGRYRLRGAFGVSEGEPRGAFRLAFACGRESAPTSSASVPIAGRSGRFDIVLPVQDCPAPWLVISVTGAETALPTTIWIDDLRFAGAT